MSDSLSSRPQHWESDKTGFENLSDDFGGMADTLDAMNGFQNPAAKGLGNLSTLFSGLGIADHLADGDYAEATIDSFSALGGALGGAGGGIVGGIAGAPGGPPGVAIGGGIGGWVGANSGAEVGSDIGHGVVALGSWAGRGLGLYDSPFTTVDVDREDRQPGMADVKGDFPGDLSSWGGTGLTDQQISDRIDAAFSLGDGTFDSGRFGDASSGSGWASGSDDGDYSGSGWDGGSGYDTGFNSDGWSGGSSSSSGWSSGSDDGDYSGSGWDGGSGYDTGFNSDGWGDSGSSDSLW